MNRSEFVIATAIVLFVAFLMGWFAYWLLHRFSRSAGADMSEVERMARELHEAEDVRDQAIAYYQAREAELINRLQQSDAELRAAMEGLRESRAEAEGLKDYVERQSEVSSFASSRTTLALTEAQHFEETPVEEAPVYEMPAEEVSEVPVEVMLEEVPPEEVSPEPDEVIVTETEDELVAADAEEGEETAEPRRRKRKTQGQDDAG